MTKVRVCDGRRLGAVAAITKFLVAPALVIALAVALPGCVDLQSASTDTTLPDQTSTTLAEVTTTSEPYHSAIHVGGGSSGGASSGGAPVIKRAGGTTLFTCKWGNKSGQFGLNSDWGSQLAPAVSPDGKTIAILDSENSRVQFFSRSGQVQKVIPLDDWGTQSIGLGANGYLYLLSELSDPRVTLIKPDGSRTVARSANPTEWGPTDLMVIGSEVWVGEGGNTFYQVFEGDKPLDDTQQLSTVQAGLPVGQKSFLLQFGDRLITVTDLFTGVTAQVQIAPGIISGDLPIDEMHYLGPDARGNCYFMARIYAQDWSGTESWDFFGVSPDGRGLGSRLSPLDFYAGGGWTVTPDGKIIEVCTTKAGVGVVEYSLR